MFSNEVEGSWIIWKQWSLLSLMKFSKNLLQSRWIDGKLNVERWFSRFVLRSYAIELHKFFDLNFIIACSRYILTGWLLFYNNNLNDPFLILFTKSSRIELLSVRINSFLFPSLFLTEFQLFPVRNSILFKKRLFERYRSAYFHLSKLLKWFARHRGSRKQRFDQRKF